MVSISIPGPAVGDGSGALGVDAENAERIIAGVSSRNCHIDRHVGIGE